MIIAIMYPGEEGLFILEGDNFENVTALKRYMKSASRPGFEEATHHLTGAPALINLDRAIAYRHPVRPHDVGIGMPRSSGGNLNEQGIPL